MLKNVHPAMAKYSANAEDAIPTASKTQNKYACPGDNPVMNGDIAARARDDREQLCAPLSAPLTSSACEIIVD